MNNCFTSFVKETWKFMMDISSNTNITLILLYSKPRIKKCDFVRHYMHLNRSFPKGDNVGFFQPVWWNNFRFAKACIVGNVFVWKCVLHILEYRDKTHWLNKVFDIVFRTVLRLFIQVKLPPQVGRPFVNSLLSVMYVE